MSKIIGIDLGTTNSCVAFMEGGAPVVIQNSEGGRTTPSIVAFTDKGDCLVGQAAKNQIVTNPENTIRSVKRFMGRTYSEIENNEKKYVGYKVERGDNDSILIRIRDKVYTPQEISARILQKMKKSAEDFLGCEIKEAVITVPAYFNDAQRQATKDAGKIAGLNVKRIVNEPTAAALAYGLDKNKNEKVAIYDLGGGTFDVTILDISDGVFEVLSTNGDTRLGGDDFDLEIINFCVSEFKKDTGIDLFQDKMAMQRIKEEAEKAKKELSGSQSVNINLPFITIDDNRNPKHLNITLTRAKFEQLIDSLVQKSKKACEDALKDAKLTAVEINQVILVGGSTRIPYIQDFVQSIFNKVPSKGVNPDEVVAMGAAVQGGILSGSVRDILLLDVTPLSLGIETLGGVMTRLIKRNVTIPVKKSQIFSTAVDNQPAVTVRVFQGERDIAQHNKLIGTFELVGIPAAPRGVPQIEVAFDIDANGILQVSAKDLGSGAEQKIRVENASGISEEEIQKMVDEAKEYENSDKEKLKLIEVKNNADNLIYKVEKSLTELKNDIPVSDAKEIQFALEQLKDSLKTDDLNSIKANLDHLIEKNKKMEQILYQKASAGSSQNTSASSVQETMDKMREEGMPGSSEDKVVDVDYEVVDDKKN